MTSWTTNTRSPIMVKTMRALATQVRLRRVIRTFGDCCDQLRERPGDRWHAAAVERRLLAQLGAVREAWAQESQSVALGARPLVRRYASRSLARLEAAVVGAVRPGASLDQIGSEFLETALALMFYVRGLEEVPDEQVAS